MKVLKFIVVLIGFLLIAFVPQKAGALISNPGFEDDFSDWSTIGDAIVDDVDDGYLGGSGPTEGSYQALVSTLSTLTDWYNLNYDDPDYDAVSGSDLEGFLGLSVGDLTDLGAVEGSAIQQSFTANAGDTLSFDWNFLTDDALRADDFAFVVIDGVLTPLADTSFSLTDSVGWFWDETGFNTSDAYTFGTSGTHTIAFGVVDVSNAYGDSGLLIDNVSLTPAVPVPEPASMLLLGSGLIGLAAFRRKFTKR